MENMEKSFTSGINISNPSCGCAHSHSNPFLGDCLFSTILCSVERYKYIIARIEALETRTSVLEEDLKQELVDREEGDTTLAKRLEDEEQIRKDNDTVLSQRIEAEEQNRIDNDSTEIQARIYGDNNVRAELTIAIQAVADSVKPVEGAEADAQTLVKLQEIGDCPTGKKYGRKGNGWNCMYDDGSWGTHFVSDAELARY